MLLDFTDPGPAWRTANDPVMGGKSRGLFRLSGAQTGIFEGRLSPENGGGFASVRIAVEPIQPAAVHRVGIRFLGDGCCYQIRLRPQDSGGITYSARFRTRAEVWETVSISRSEFEPVYRGRSVDTSPPWMTSKLCEIGFLIADRQFGPFRLEIDWVRID